MDHFKLNIYGVLILISEFIEKNMNESNSDEYKRALEDVQKIIIENFKEKKL